jgi:uncharacterized protein
MPTESAEADAGGAETKGAAEAEAAEKQVATPKAATPKPVEKAKASLGATIRKRWRGWLRAVHRDIGYLAVGLTVIYALSGLAINHLQDWDPNFHSFSRESKIEPIPADVPDEEAFARVRKALDLGKPRETYRAGDEIHLTYDGREVVVYGDSGQVTDQGQSPRFFLRVANWLHYNRGKRAWTYIADGYAVLLLYLAISGMFMIKGKLGLKWRGLALVALGAGVPLAYVVLSGGPGANAKKTAEAEAAAAKVAPGEPAAEEPEEPGERMTPRQVPGEKTAPREGPGDDAQRMAPRAVPGEKTAPREVPGDDTQRMAPRAVPGEKTAPREVPGDDTQRMAPRAGPGEKTAPREGPGDDTQRMAPREVPDEK